MSEPQPQPAHVAPAPLLPRTPTTAAAAGGIGAAVLATLGWLAQTILTLESRITRVEERQTNAITELHAGQRDNDNDVRQMRDRMTVIEQRIIDHFLNLPPPPTRGRGGPEGPP